MKKLIVYLLLLACSSKLYSQPMVYTVGDGGLEYPNLQEAFADINAGNITGDIVLQIIDNCTQPGTAVLYPTGYLGNSSYSSIIIYPVGPGYSIIGDVNGPLIELNGAANVTFDGRVNQAGAADLVITNQNTGVLASTIQFTESANTNIINFCIIKGAETGASSGVIFFSTSSSGGGNDANKIDNNFITADAAGRPVNAIFSAGTSGSENSGNIISNNNIHDFFNPGTASNGILLAAATTGWTITGNSFYESTSFVPSAAVTYNVMQINNTSGTGFIVSGNYIGGNSPLAAGGAWTKINGSNNQFFAINVNAGTGTVSSLQNNTISNFIWSNTSNASWTAINIAAGDLNIGTVTGNTIGATTGTGSVTVTGGATGTNIFGINIAGAGTVNCQNNKIGSVTAANSGSANATNFTGINKTSTGGSTNISSNLIGSATTTGSLLVSSPSTGNPQSLFGISYSGTAAGTITGNSVGNLVNNTTSAAGSLAGLNFNGTSGAGNVSGNFIFSLTAVNSANNASVYGLRILSGSTTYANNIITLGGSIPAVIYGIYETGTAGNNNNIFFNSVYIGGTPSSGTANSYALYNNANTNTRDFRNNILYNARSNSGATGKHYAGFINIAGGSLTCDYNDYYVTGSGGVLGFYGADQTVLPVVTLQDSHSLAINPLFATAGGTAAADYIPAETTLIGVSGTTVVTDYNGAARASTPVMGAFETGACSNPTDGGIIASAQSGCSPFDPLGFTSTTLATGFIGGTDEYKWQQSVTGSGSGFTDILSGNSSTYDPGALTQTTWFKRLARVSCKSDWTGAAESNVLMVTVNALPVAGAITGGSEVCIGSALSLASGATGTPPLTYIWLSSNPTVATVDNNGNVTPVSPGSTNITYKVTDGSSTACQATSPVHPITVNALPVANPITGGSALCMNSTLTLIPHATGTPVLIYTWNSTNPAVATVSNSGVVTAVSTGSTIIRYSVTDGSTTACSAISAPQTLTVNPLPVAGAITGGSSLCMGGTLTLTSHATGTPVLTYIWASSNTTVATVNNSGVVTPVSAGTTNITYTVTDGSITLCSATSPNFAVTVNSLPAISLTVGGAGNICSGSSSNITVALSEAGINYQLRNAVGNINIGTPVAGTGGTISLPTGNLTSTTTFNILATNTLTSCQSQLTQTVTVSVDPPSVGGTLTGGPGPVIYGSSTGVITLSGYTGLVIKWQRLVDSGPWTDIVSTSATYSEIPASVGVWQYRAAVQSGTCPPAFSTPFSITVSPKTLSIAANNQAKNYGALFAFTGTEFTVTGLINSDAVTSVTLTSAATAATADVNGSPYPITAGAAVGTGLGNYNISYTDGTFTVNKAVLTVTANSLSKVYGTANPPLLFSYSGFQNGEDESVLNTKPVAATTITISTPAGLYTGAITVSGGSDNNYNFIYVAGNFTITKADQTVTFGVLVNKTYGDADFNITATAGSGLTVSFVSSAPTVATVTGTLVHIVGAGTTIITASQSGDNNYNAAVAVPQQLIINKANLTFTADNKSRIYLALNPVFTYTVSGFVLSETVAVLDALPSIQTTAIQSSPAGNYPITLSGGNDNNYNYISVAGTLTISKSPQTITFTDFPSRLQVGDSRTMVASSTSGLTVLFESADTSIAAVSGDVLTGVSKGSTEIRAYHPGDQNFFPAEAFETVEITSSHKDIMHLFTPNNDGFNDYWELPDLASWGKCDVKLYNRWGKLVFSDPDYNNHWEGTSGGNPLPEGAYYFIIKTENAGVVKGTVNLVR